MSYSDYINKGYCILICLKIKEPYISMAGACRNRTYRTQDRYVPLDLKSRPATRPNPLPQSLHYNLNYSLFQYRYDSAIDMAHKQENVNPF